MRKSTLYSSSRRSQGEPRAPASEEPPPAPAKRPREWRNVLRRHERFITIVASGLLAVAIVVTYSALTPTPRQIQQADIDAAVLHTLQTKPLPSKAAKAYEIIRPSVVRVRGLGDGEFPEQLAEQGVGSGVVIVDSGIILTNLHVVAGAKKVRVVFSDGLESEADIIAAQPENDLAVLQARTIPDDLMPATMRSTKDLAEGDEVIAVG